ncbi:MAG: S41 family peptidase, partial [Bacteroidota bacterium]
GLMGTIDFDQVELQIQNDEAPIDIRLNNAAFDEAASFETDWKPSGPNQDFAIKNENGNPYLSASRTKGSLEYTPPLFPKNTLKDKFLHKPVGNGLSIEFPMVISKDEQTKFSVSKAGAFEALQSKVDSIQNISLENKYVRLANLVKAWNNFQHFYPYFDLIDLDWEDQLRQAILQNETDQNMADHLKTLKIMLAPLKDSHLGVYTQADQFFPPIKVEIAEDHLVLTEVLDAKLSLKPGNSIIRINGQNVEAYWDEHSQKAQGATLTRKALTTIEEILAGTENSFLELELVGLDTAVQLRRTWSEHTYGTVSSKLDRSPFLEMETGIYYINLSEVSWEFLQEQMQLLAGAKGLVFDLRGYPSWKTINIVSHLTEDTLQQLQLYTPEVLFPDQENRSWQPSEVVKMYPNKPLLDAKKIFLTDANAISYSETFLNLIKHYQLATIVGQQTAGSTGNVNMLYLYGGISIPWTGMKVLDQNGAAFQGHGILPDYPVAKTIKGISNGQDEYLNAALKILYQQLN